MSTPEQAPSARNLQPPSAQASLGAGVVVTDASGRVLLGLHRSGVWELPGGKVEPGESVEDAAVRELAEETSLVADAADVEVLGLILDSVTSAALTRMTVATVVRGFRGMPTVTEPDNVTRWEWTEPDRLPTELFVPSGQVLRMWRPELSVPDGPFHRYAMSRLPR